MKKLLMFILLLTVFSCSKEDNIDQTQKEDNIETRQERITTVPLFEPCDAANLIVLVDLSDCIVGTMWECAIIGAIDAYNNLPENIGIGMTVLTDIEDVAIGEAVNITINCSNTSIPGGASATRRETALDVSDILLETNFENNWPCAGQTPICCQMQKIVMHELGHSLGLGHTEGDTPDAEWIEGTPMGEANSIFNVSATDGWCNSSCGFTAGDLTALEILYPCDCIPNVSITGDFDLCGNETATYCLNTPLDVQWNTPVISNNNCIEVTGGNWNGSILLAATVSQNGCDFEHSQVVNFHEDEACPVPSQPPYGFSEICLGKFEPVCYDFASLGCVETIQIESSSPKLLPVIDGTKVCLNYIWTKPTTVQLDVTFTSWCGDIETGTWTIDVVDCDEVVIINPPNTDDPPTGGGPTADDCSDFENPCPCETASDCPPGWKCIGGGGNKICIEI